MLDGVSVEDAAHKVKQYGIVLPAPGADYQAAAFLGTVSRSKNLMAISRLYGICIMSTPSGECLQGDNLCVPANAHNAQKHSCFLVCCC